MRIAVGPNAIQRHVAIADGVKRCVSKIGAHYAETDHRDRIHHLSPRHFLDKVSDSIHDEKDERIGVNHYRLTPVASRLECNSRYLRMMSSVTLPEVVEKYPRAQNLRPQ